MRDGLHEGQEQREATQGEPPAPSAHSAAVSVDAMSLQAPLSCCGHLSSPSPRVFLSVPLRGGALARAHFLGTLWSPNLELSCRKEPKVRGSRAKLKPGVLGSLAVTQS